MKFIVSYYVGKHLREKKIVASSLELAEKLADERFKDWESIVMEDKTKGVECYE